MYTPKLPKDIRCPLEYALELFHGRWKSRILCMLYSDQSLRYGTIKKNLVDVTDTMLASALKELLTAELIVRMQYPEIPPRVEYALTEKGRSLVPLLKNVCRWASSFHDTTGDEPLMRHCRECGVRLGASTDCECTNENSDCKVS